MVTNRSPVLDVRSVFSLMYNIQLYAYQLLYRMQNYLLNVDITTFMYLNSNTKVACIIIYILCVFINVRVPVTCFNT